MPDNQLPSIIFVPRNPYTNRTNVFIPVIVRFAQCGAIMGLEWTTLSYIESAPLAARIATFIVSLLILAVVQVKGWLDFKGRYYFFGVLLSLLVLYVCVCSYSFYSISQSSEAPNKVPYVVQSLPADAAKITALAREGDNLRAQLQALQSQLDAATQAQTSVVGPNFIEYPQINFSNQDEDVVVEGTAANRITEDLNVSIYYRTQGIKGSSPMGTWRRAVTSIGTVSKAIKGAEITPIAVLHKIVDHYVIGGDTTGFPLNAGEIAYIRASCKTI
jgi:hypothetical protein